MDSSAPTRELIPDSYQQPGYSSKRPIILDDSYASPETVALHEEGYEGALVARADSPRTPMSAYGKPPPHQLHGNGYDAGRPFPDGAFAYPAPLYGQSSANSSTSSPAFPNATPIMQMAYPPSQPRASYDDQAGPYLNVGSTPTPAVKDFVPRRGPRGTKFQVTITTLYELLTSNEPTFFLVFGQTKVQASLTRTGQQGSICQYVIETDVPQLAATGYVSSQVPVSMFMESGDGDVIAKVDVGTFTYIDPTAHVGNNTPQDNSRKRKMSNDSEDLMENAAKRFSGHQIRPKDEYAQYGYASNGNPNFSTYLQPSPGLQSSNYNVMHHPYNRPVANYQTQSRGLGYPYSNSNSPPAIKAQSPQSWGSPYPSLSSSMGRGPGMPTHSGMSRSVGSLPSPSLSANPPLIRTSTLQQTPSPAATPHGGAPHYNSYTLYPHRAKLEIKGDLDSMTVNWTPEEWEAKRRLVMFRRSQSGSTITTTFSPVTADERPPNSICVSCIMWDEREGGCYVTSVDTISLLEQLVAARFTVEEKNRIRRNLEGFRPQTVSKAKADSEEFFKLIMAFPPPKPRNIEKDVKVFHWKDLTPALKKIIGKYSASPSSTLPPTTLLTPVSSTGYATEGSGATLSYVSEHQGAVSPRSISTASTAYNANSNLHVRMSPHSQKSMALQTGSSDHRVAVPPAHDSAWQSSQHAMQGSQYQQLGQGARGWDINTNYMDNPATAGATPAHSQDLSFQTSNSADASDLQCDDAARGLSSSRKQSQQVRRLRE